MRTSFTLDQEIAIVAGGSYFDLHNNFDFVGFEYCPTERCARLQWARGEGDWVSRDLPKSLTLRFHGVSNFAVRRRDHDLPFTEDSCVASIGFLPPEFSEDYAAICPDYRSDDEHLSIQFQSGLGVKLWAETATHEIDPAGPPAPTPSALSKVAGPALSLPNGPPIRPADERR